MQFINPINVPSVLDNRQDPVNPNVTIPRDDITSPIDIPNCELWLDASNGPLKSDWTVPADGEAVSVWQDGSGNARHATIQAGTPLFKATEGYGGKPSVKIGAVCRMVTPAFVDATFANAITMFIVSKPDAVLHSSVKIKASISTTGFYIGNTATTRNVDVTLNGVAGFSRAGAYPEISGIDMICLGTTNARCLLSGFGTSFGSSITTADSAITGGATYTNGVVVVGGLTGVSTYDWPGTISEIIIYKRELTNAEQRRVYNYLSAKYEVKKKLALLSNSLGSGFGSTSGAAQAISASGDNLPGYLISNYGSLIDYKNDAYPGRTLNNLITETPLYTGIFADSNTIVVIWEGTNTLTATNSVAKTYSELKRLCAMKKGIGNIVVVGTVLYRGGTGDDAKNAALTDAINTLIRDNYTDFADEIIDFAADSRLQDFNDTTYFYTDTIHLNSAGYAVCAELLGPLITRLA